MKVESVTTKTSIAIKAEGICKTFALRDANSNSFAKPGNANPHEIRSLTDVSFEMKSGDVLGLIGANGSGKSTLLKILAGICMPTKGRITIRGKVASILDVGSGFHPDLSGKENVYMCGQLLGMTNAEIDECYQNIVDYSGIKEFMNVAVKYYSSGMYMRLAFSIVVNLNTEILLIDEVISVGDAEFKIKSLERIKELARSGKTIIIASHDLNSISNICTRCLFLEHGRVKYNGDTKNALVEYINDTMFAVQNAKQEAEEPVVEEGPPVPDVAGNETSDDVIGTVPEKTTTPQRVLTSVEWLKPEDAPGNEQIRIKRVNCISGNVANDKIFYSHKPVTLEFEYWKQDDTPTAFAFIGKYMLDTPAFLASPGYNQDQRKWHFVSSRGLQKALCTIPAHLLNNGFFSIDLYFVNQDNKEVYYSPNIISFKVDFEESYYEQFFYDGNFPGPFFLAMDWQADCID
jgi:lipopolysaccharide transport system ATP-binding protein